MGSGQWQILPTAVARYLLPGISNGSWVSAGARYDIGFDVDEGQSRKNGLHLAPSVNFEFPKVWYLTLYPDTEIRINLGNGDKGRLFLPLDFLLLWNVVETHVILDIKLRCESGVDVLKRIANEFPSLPAILCSAYVSFQNDYTFLELEIKFRLTLVSSSIRNLIVLQV